MQKIISRYGKMAVNTITLTGILCCAALVIYGWKSGIFSSQETLEVFLQSMGLWAPILFVMIQAVQVVIPIIPGGVSCLAGVAFFGAFKGFLYNYIGICIGSVCAFLLSKRYGNPIVRAVAGEKRYEKYSKWLDREEKFPLFFSAAIFFPCALDDLLCYIAGLTKMSVWRFTAIILIGKPFSIALYSFGLWIAAVKILGGSGL